MTPAGASNVVRLPGNRGVDGVTGTKGQLKLAYRPSNAIKLSWKEEGKRRGDHGYQQRWTAFWGRVVRAVAAFGSVDTLDMRWVEEYVLHCRLAELHLHEATREPYQVYPDSGYIAAHPGFAQARSESKEARALAAELGLTPTARRAAGIEAPPPTSASDGPADDQVGPEGEAL